MSHFDNVKKFFDDERFSDKILCFVLPSNSSSSVAESHDEGEGINLSPIAEESQPQGIDQEPRTARQVVRRIHVSSMLLASSSRFFEAMFSSGMKESNQKELEIQVADIAEAERIGHIIRFCYSTELPSHWIVNDFIEALSLCDRFGCDSAFFACCSALVQKLTVDVCSRVLALPAEIHLSEPCNHLLAVCKAFLLREFKDFEKHHLSDKFLSLSAEAACSFLESDELQVQSEQTVYLAVRIWLILHKQRITSQCPNKTRKRKAEDLLPGSNASSELDSKSSQQGRCSSSHPCASCLELVSSVAAKLLHCLRLPQCSASYLHDVVRNDQIFLLLDSPCPSLSSPRNQEPRSVRHTFQLMYLEAREWQGLPQGQKDCAHPPSTISELRHPFFSPQSPNDSKESPSSDTKLPSRFMARSGPPEVPQVTYGEGIRSGTGAGHGTAFMWHGKKCFQWQIPSVASMEENCCRYSPMFGVEGYVFRLMASKVKEVNSQGSLVFWFIALPCLCSWFSDTIC